MGCDHSACHSRTNGAIKRLNQTLINILKKLTEENQSNWDILLPSNGLAYRPRIHTLTQ